MLAVARALMLLNPEKIGLIDIQNGTLQRLTPTVLHLSVLQDLQSNSYSTFLERHAVA
jgi:hypothetical protein